MNIERTTALVLLCVLARAPATQALEIQPGETEFVFGFDLDDVENDGEISGVPGHTLSATGYVTLHSPEAGVSGWSFGFGAGGAGVSIADWIVDGCDKACLSDWRKLEPDDVFFYYRESVDPLVENQGPGVVCAVALRPFPSPTAILPAGISPVLPFGLEVQVTGEQPDEIVTLEFRDGLVGSREPVDVDIRSEGGTVDPVLCPFRFHVRPTEPFRLAFELDGIERGEVVEGVAGETHSVKGHVALDSPVAGVSGWTFGVGANGAEVSFDEETVDGCDPACLAGLLGLDADDVFFHTSQVVDPSVSDQGPGIVTAVALSVFPAQATLPRGISRLLSFALDVPLPDAPEGEIEIELEFRDGLVGSGQPVSIGINLENRNVNPVLVSYRFGVLPIVYPRFVRGDCNEDGSADLADVICLLDRLFVGPPPGCLALSDINGDKKVNVSDPTSLLLYLFLNRAPPVEPFPECGPGRSEADELLGCDAPPAVCR